MLRRFRPVFTERNRRALFRARNLTSRGRLKGSSPLTSRGLCPRPARFLKKAWQKLQNDARLRRRPPAIVSLREMRMREHTSAYVQARRVSLFSHSSFRFAKINGSEKDLSLLRVDHCAFQPRNPLSSHSPHPPLPVLAAGHHVFRVKNKPQMRSAFAVCFMRFMHRVC